MIAAGFDSDVILLRPVVRGRGVLALPAVGFLGVFAASPVSSSAGRRFPLDASAEPDGDFRSEADESRRGPVDADSLLVEAVFVDEDLLVDRTLLVDEGALLVDEESLVDDEESDGSARDGGARHGQTHSQGHR
jgi:hypothetical protein